MISIFSRRSTDGCLAEQSLRVAKSYLARHDSLRDTFQALRYESLCNPRRQVEQRIESALALASAAMMHCYGVEPYPTQLLAAHWMARGKIVDMATGEGKSIAVLLAAITMTVQGYGVHIATANDYLAQRDREFAHRITVDLGLRCDRVPSTGCEVTNRQAYDADLTFGTLSGFAFDHLRDELAIPSRQSRLGWQSDFKRIARSRRHRLIIDEVDHGLLDEASTPFVMADAGTSRIHSDANHALPYQVAREIACQMQAHVDFEQSSAMDIRLTSQGSIGLWQRFQHAS